MYAFSQINATTARGGTYKIADSTVFPVATKISSGCRSYSTTRSHAGASLAFYGGRMGLLTYIFSGQARITLFAGSSSAGTFDSQAGDISYVPASYGHYVENIGNETLRYLEVFNTDRYSDVSLRQWLATAPPALVKAHLGWGDSTIAQLSKMKPVVVAPYTP